MNAPPEGPEDEDGMADDGTPLVGRAERLRAHEDYDAWADAYRNARKFRIWACSAASLFEELRKERDIFERRAKALKPAADEALKILGDGEEYD